MSKVCRTVQLKTLLTVEEKARFVALAAEDEISVSDMVRMVPIRFSPKG